jgi:hypothetical protein
MPGRRRRPVDERHRRTVTEDDVIRTGIAVADDLGRAGKRAPGRRVVERAEQASGGRHLVVTEAAPARMNVAGYVREHVAALIVDPEVPGRG